MEQKVCVDSDVIIELLCSRSDVIERFAALRGSRFYISSISLFELLQRETRIQDMKDFLEDFEFIPLDEYVAAKGAEIMRHLRKSGKLVEFRDVLIAASCIIEDCSLLTLNRRHFEKIKELKLL
ncbi:MAG: type II toxin-antitoxin system VapC family toxin [Nanoarchaeota archaeon]